MHFQDSAMAKSPLMPTYNLVSLYIIYRVTEKNRFSWKEFSYGWAEAEAI